MALHAHSLVSTILDEHPYTDEVFAWYGVRLGETLRGMSLYALCWIRNLELEELIAALEAVIDAEDDPTEELTAEEWAALREASAMLDDDDLDWGDYYAIEGPDLAFEVGVAAK